MTPVAEIPPPPSCVPPDCRYDGIFMNRLHSFTDLVTKSSFATPLDATPQFIRQRLDALRDRFVPKPRPSAFCPSHF